MKKPKRKGRKPSLPKIKPNFGIKPRTVFFTGIAVLLLVVAFSFSQIKTSQTGFAVKPESTPENSVRNLKQLITEFGNVCEYELFLNGEWTVGHTSILTCNDFAEGKNIIE